MTVAKVLSIPSANCNQVAQAFNPGGPQSFVFLPLYRPTVSTSPCLQLETLRNTEGGGCLHVSTITMNACDEHDQSRGANAFAEEEYTETIKKEIINEIQDV